MITRFKNSLKYDIEEVIHLLYGLKAISDIFGNINENIDFLTSFFRIFI